MPPKALCIDIKKIPIKPLNPLNPIKPIKKEESHECNVCLSDIILGKYIMCQMCKGTTCTECQLEYGKPFCANAECNYQYTQYQLILTYSKAVLDNSNMGRYWREIYLEREKQLLPLAQMYIDHDEKYEKFRRNMRFGSFNKIDPVEKKTFEDFCSQSDVILQKCPSRNCSSYISGTTMFCQKCGVKFCTKCNEPESVGHVCDESTIKTIAEIKNNSKPCPNCYVRIQKSEGCDHMRCTNCSTFFSYSTLKVHKKNSNPIKDDEVFGSGNLSNKLSSKKLTPLDHSPNSPNSPNSPECSMEGSIEGSNASDNDECSGSSAISLPHNKMTSICFEDCCDTEGLIVSGDHQYMRENVLLNRDPYSLLYIYNNNYQTYKISRKYMKSLFDDRIKFLKGTIKIDKWIDNIYKNEFEYHRSIAISDVLRSYLKMISYYITNDLVNKKLLENIKTHNTKLEEIYYTYGDTLFKINDVNSVDTISWIVDKKKVIT